MTLRIVEFTFVKNVICVSVHFTHVLHRTKAAPIGWKAGTNYRARELTTLLFFFSFSVVYHYLWNLQINPFSQAQVTLQLKLCLFDLVLRLLAGPPLLGSRSRPRRP